MGHCKLATLQALYYCTWHSTDVWQSNTDSTEYN